MNTRERETVKQAIRLLMEDDPDFARAVSMLCGLVGWSLPQHDLTKDVKLVPVNELAGRGQQTFRAPLGSGHV